MPFVFNEKDRHYNNIPDVPIARNWNDLPEDERKREFKRAEELGFVAPRKDGFFTEMGQAALGAAYGVGKGLGSTLEETTGYSGMKKYFGDVMLQNQHLNPYPGYKALSLNPTDIARTIGSGAAQSTLALGGAVVGGVLGGGIGGIAASTGMMFAQIYGDRVQEYREAYPNQDNGTVQGLAFLSSLGESLIESVIGPEQLATGIAKKWATGALKETTKGFAKTVGKEALKNFLTEGSEEVAQDFWDRVCRMGLEEQGIQLPSWEEVGETFMGGAWSGLALGAVGGGVESIGSKKAEAAPTVKPEESSEAEEETAPYDPESERKTKLTLADQVAKELGIKVRYFDEAKTRGKDMDIADGWYDEKTGEIWLDRENPNADVMKNLGHEFKHFLDDKQKGLIQKFNDLFSAGINEAGNARAAEIEDLYQKKAGQVGRGFDELSADTFGEFWADPEFWRDVSTRAEKMESGMGKKFIETLQEFIKIVTAKLKKIGTPEAKQLFDNMNELREEAANILAEIKRQNGTSTEEENVVGVNGSTTVESVPVSEINLDPERFQFKSNTSKVTGVDESNKLGGEWDPKSAGIIYVWEDKDGNKFVVNGHHRLELAKRKNVKEMNAIVDREADNVTAEQARRNGVLINIRDEQGEIRDYADFVRSEKLDEETAEKEGVLSRRKGRAGFAIGHYASDNLYATYRNGDISDTAAATISDIARGDIGLENAGIKAAKSGMKKIQLVEHLKLLKSMDSLRQKSEDEQGDLFGGFDDSVLKMSEELSAKALDHIEELKEQINAAKAAVKNPDAAKKLGVSVGKEAQNLLDRTKRKLQEWENWQTNKKLFDQLLRETGNVMPEETPAHEESTSEAKQPAAEVEAAQPAPEQQPDFLDEHIVVSGAPITGTQVAEALAGQGAQAEQQGAQAEAQQGGSSWGANNTIVSQDAYEKAKKQLRKAMGRMNVGIDPEILSNGAIVAAFHVEAGARKFAEFSAKMIEDLGDKIKPYLKALYESARRFPGAENIAKDMDSTDYVDKYDLEITVHEDWDVITKSQEDLVEGDKNGTFFEQPVTLKKISVKEQRKIRDAKEVQAEIDENVGGTSEAVERNLEKHFRNIDKDIEELEKHYIGENRKPEYIRDRKHLLRDGVNYFKTFIRNNANQMLELQVGDDSYTGIITGYHTIGKYSPKSPFIPSAMIVDVAVADSAGKLSIPFSKFVGGGEVTYSASFLDLEDAFTGENRAVRTDMYAFTGNLLRAINLAERGKVVSYKTNDGKVENALLMPKNWNSEAMRDPRREFKTAQEILDAVGNNGYVATYDGSVFRSNGGYSIDLPRTRGGGKDARFVKDRGLIEITGDFESFGRSMRSNRLTKKQAQDALEYMMNNGTTFVRPREDIHYHIPMKQRQQVNPIREEGAIKEKYQKILDKMPYESKSNKVLNTQAARMLAGFGGIDGTIKAIENGDFKPTSDAAQRALQIVLNSEEFKRLSDDDRASVANVYIKSGTEAGRTLASRRLGVLDTSDILSVQAHVNAIIAKMGKENAHRLRDEILHELGLDIDKLPDDIVNEPRELDKVLRKLIAARSKWTDKWYEYWINAILSSPTTHVANTIGNVTNAVYELGVKRLAEATINAFLKRKDAATFGEFKEMTRAIDWKDAWRRAQFMFDVETMDTHSKLDTIHAAIGGKTGRIVRIPGRLLRAADEFAKAVVVPIEAAAYAYRQGANLGYSGDVLREFIQDQLKNEKSLANEWGKMRSLELTFQEQNRPGSAVNYLIQLREAGGISGTIMKFVLPFIKTPSNILKQGIRKSPLGAVNLAWQTVKGFAGKREFDSEYVSLAAEQLLAWGVVMMLAGSDDDDDKPFITGSSPQYGSAENRFKANKVPPYSIRIGKNYYSYQRIEPLSTGLAFIADGIEAYKAAKRGEDGQKIMRTLIAKSGRLISEKSFLDSIGTITKIAQDPEQSGMKYLTNFAASWSPNIVRHTINMFDDNVREGKARDRGMNWFEEQFYATMNAAGLIKASPKYDYFGRPVKKDSLADSGPLWQMMRLIPVRSVSPDDNMNRAEKLMWKYNMTHPGEEYYPDVPAYYFQRDGQKLYMTGKYWDEFAQKSGQLALKQINNAFKHGLLNERKPSKEDIDLIKKIFTRARKEVRDEMYQHKHYQR